ncbi:Fc.00g094110.m01.CDS01 [Cosmosporella sp. VM-42]
MPLSQAPIFMDSSNPGPSDPRFLNIPYDARWEYLKENIIRLYIEVGEKVDHLSERMKTEFSFSAPPHAYRYRFRKWGIKKSTSTKVKLQIIKRHAKRSREDASTSDITVVRGGHEKGIDKKKLKRYLKDQIRHREQPMLQGGIFVRWNVPYAALAGNARSPNDPNSPFESHSNSPACLIVNSPEDLGTPSAPGLGASPMTQMIRQKADLDRADLFIQGRYQDLLMQLGQRERRVVSNWLHDFWIHSFMTAKYWGRGPENWTPALIEAKSLGAIDFESASPTAILGWASATSPGHADSIAAIDPPTQLCRWSIHYFSTMRYESVPSPPRESRQEQDIEDESTWAPWTMTHDTPTFAQRMTSALSENSFSRINQEDLPLSTSSIIDAVARSEDQIEADSWAFAIMARNTNSLLGVCDFQPATLKNLYPFHLAAAYLDGAKDCCLTLESLMSTLEGENSLAPNYKNDLGHTVLDSLMINILRSHTSVTPGMVCEALGDKGRFPGEDVDICGRWDADTKCVRQLYASGRSTVPLEWKHAFCHTAAQVICHSITTIFSPRWSVDIDTSSGLFLKRCGGCGKDLELLPLHTLVLIAFYLVRFGTNGETMFGIIAILVCMLVHGADPTQAADISVWMLLGIDNGEGCNHQPITPSTLASQILNEGIETCPSELNLGWRAFVAVLNFVHSARLRDQYQTPDPRDPEGFDCDHDDYGLHAIKNFYCGSRDLGIIWAAIQIELLTYRRIKDTDPWVSTRFNMQQLMDGLESGLGLTNIPLHQDGMMSKFTNCGWFVEEDFGVDPVCPSAGAACDHYFMNLEDWNRPKIEIKTWIKILSQWPSKDERTNRMNLDVIKSRTDGYVAITASPGCSMVPELMTLYPDAKVICTVRGFEAWEKSMQGVASASTRWFLRFVLFLFPSLRFFVDYINGLRQQWLYLYGEIEPPTKKSYNRHIEWLKEKVPTNRLVLFDVKDSWEPLCRALGMPVPKNLPFPQINDGKAIDTFAKKHVTRGLVRWMLVLALIVATVAITTIAW